MSLVIITYENTELLKLLSRRFITRTFYITFVNTREVKVNAASCLAAPRCIAPTQSCAVLLCCRPLLPSPPRPTQPRPSPPGRATINIALQSHEIQPKGEAYQERGGAQRLIDIPRKISFIRVEGRGRERTMRKRRHTR